MTVIPPAVAAEIRAELHLADTCDRLADDSERQVIRYRSEARRARARAERLGKNKWQTNEAVS